MVDTEDSALRAYSRIQSLLDLPEEYGDSNYLLETPAHESRPRFVSPPSTRNSVIERTPSQQQHMSVSVFQGQRQGDYQSSNITEIADLNINEEGFERKFHPDEQVFHGLLQQTMEQVSTAEVSGIFGMQAPDNYTQAEIVGRYACAAQDRFIERAQEARRYGAGIEIGVAQSAVRKDSKEATLQISAQNQRAERDLWSLLETLTSCNLLHDIDDAECDRLARDAISNLPVTATIADYLAAAFNVDARLRKGAVLKDWIEKASLDLVVEAPAPRGEPWAETLNRILKCRHGSSRGKISGPGYVQSVHPDGQLTEDGSLLSLDGVDRVDQESLLKSIWQLVRCGLISRAQQLAAEHRLFWLSASLQGIAAHTYKEVNLSRDDIENLDQNRDENDFIEVVGVAQEGNHRQPIWLRTCWLYSEKLSGCLKNCNLQPSSTNATVGSISRGLRREESLVGLLETAIYAALCNNTKVLAASPLVPSWQDKVWLYLKAAHERDIAFIVHQYRSAKAALSKFYVGCDSSTIAAEKELFDWSKVEIGHMSTGNCVQIFNAVSPPNGGKTAEFYLLNLQAAVMEGRSGIFNFIETTMTDFLQGSEDFPDKEQVLRVFCHLCIWLKYAHTDEAALPEVVSIETMYLSIERYIDLLIQNKQRSLVAAYAAFLNRPRRIAKYAQLLRSTETSSANINVGGNGQFADAAEVLQLANAFFPADVMDITRSVVEEAHHQQSEPTSAAGMLSQPTSSRKTLNASRAPPLMTLSSPIDIGGVKSTAGRPSVRFNIAENDESDTTGAGLFGTATPNKFSVRNRTATPRPLKVLGGPNTPVSIKSGPHNPGCLSGTPQVGSELLLLSHDDNSCYSDRVQHTRLRPAASSSVSTEDIQQLESLRWLFFEPTHRIEAVKHANRFAVSFFLHKDGMKLAQVRLLLANYVPLDSITVGDALIAQREQAIEDIELKYRHQSELNDSMTLPSVQRNHLQDLHTELTIEEKLWNAQVCKLLLWQQFTSAMQDLDVFYRSVAEFQSESSRLLSLSATSDASFSVPSALARYRSKINRTATTAADAILLAISCGLGVSETAERTRNPANGFKDIWTQNEEACCNYIKTTTKLLVQHINDLLHRRQNAPADDELPYRSWRAISSAISALWELVQEVYPLSVETDAISMEQHPVRVAVSALVNLAIPQSNDFSEAGHGDEFDDESSSSTSTLSDSALSIVTALAQCKLHMCDVRDGKSLAGGLLFQMLSSYLQMCMSAGSILSALQQIRDASSWYAKGMQLADLVAAEDHALQLYTLLHKDDLQALLLGINAAAMALLSIDPEMRI